MPNNSFQLYIELLYKKHEIKSITKTMLKRYVRYGRIIKNQQLHCQYFEESIQCII